MAQGNLDKLPSIDLDATAVPQKRAEANPTARGRHARSAGEGGANAVLPDGANEHLKDSDWLYNYEPTQVPNIPKKKSRVGTILGLFVLLALAGGVAWGATHLETIKSLLPESTSVAAYNEANEVQEGSAENGTSQDLESAESAAGTGDMADTGSTGEGQDGAAVKPDSWSISFASTGDMIFGRQVGDYVDMNGGAAPLEHVAEQLAAKDVTIGNLEAPLSNDESEGIWTKDVLLISRPEAIEGLKNCDFTFLSLANNHSMDYGQPALEDTMKALDSAGIKYAGAGLNYDEAWRVAETSVNGVSIAFISFTDVIPDYFLAYEDGPGVAAARIDMDFACSVVEQAAKTHDIVVVAAHWGEEYQDYTTEWLQDVPAHQLVDAGADVILGNHPHVIQGIEFYQGALISYSQGDFVFDHFSTRKTGETFILNFDFTEHGIENVEAVPIYLEDPYGIPGVVVGDEAVAILNRLEEISIGFNTSYEMRDDKAYVTATDGNMNSRAKASANARASATEGESSAEEAAVESDESAEGTSGEELE